jgi:murein DD-endopeptidase MepM/ murein hydrolase activator NlpD
MEPSLKEDLIQFILCLFNYLRRKIFGAFWVLEESKSKLASQLYQKRGKYARPFIHSGMVVLMIAAVTLGPILIAEASPEIEQDFWEKAPVSTSILAATDQAASTYTFISEKPRAEIIEYEVKSGDTISSIAQRYGVSVDTVLWENNLASPETKIKPGQLLKILPATGVSHQVKRGETIYSIAEKYDVSAQAIVDWPYNTFADDETFALAVGQVLIVPDGVMPEKKPVAPRPYYAQITPEAGAVTGTGQFAWPVGGQITQWYRAWHRGIDIANRSLPGIAAADTGTVILTGWPAPWAYGNRILIDHGNGYQSFYAHLSAIYVSPGDQVSRGEIIGKMGSTGRSTGPHLHFEIRRSGTAVDPMGFLK